MSLWQSTWRILRTLFVVHSLQLITIYGLTPFRRRMAGLEVGGGDRLCGADFGFSGEEGGGGGAGEGVGVGGVSDELVAEGVGAEEVAGEEGVSKDEGVVDSEERGEGVREGGLMMASGVEEGDAADARIVVIEGGVQERRGRLVVDVGEELDGGASDVVVAVFPGEVEQESEGLG